MGRDISPEERLLRLIRKRPKEAKDKDAKEKLETPKAPSEKQVPKSEVKKAPIKGKVDILNRFLLGGLVILLAYFLFGLFTTRPVEVGIEEPTLEEEFEAEREPFSELKPYESYVEAIGARELFTPLISEEETNLEAAVTLGELASNLNLIGIMESDGKLQAIIEDKQMKKNYFLFRGDFIGEIEIMEVQEGKVILGYGEEKLDLVL